MAGWPLNATWVAPAKFAPLIATLVPTGPLDGLNPEMLGGVPAAAGNDVMEITRATIAAVAPARISDRAPISVRCIMTLPWIDEVCLSSVLEDVPQVPGLPLG